MACSLLKYRCLEKRQRHQITKTLVSIIRYFFMQREAQELWRKEERMMKDDGGVLGRQF
jgi:hypothetical protein